MSPALILALWENLRDNYESFRDTSAFSWTDFLLLFLIGETQLGGGGGGGGGGTPDIAVTAGVDNAAFNAVLDLLLTANQTIVDLLRNQIEPSENIVVDINTGVQYIRLRTVSEETGIATVSYQTFSGANVTPPNVNDLRAASVTDGYEIVTTPYEVNATGDVIFRSQVYVNGVPNSVVWFNFAGNAIAAPSINDVRVVGSQLDELLVQINTAITNLNTTQTATNTALGSINSEITNINADQDTIITRLGSINAGITANNTKLDTISGTTDSINTGVGAANITLNTAVTQLNAINSASTSTNTKLDTANTALTTLNTSTTTVNTSVQAVTTAVDNNTTATNTVGANIVNAVNGIGTNIVNAVTALRTSLEARITTTILGTINTSIGTVGTNTNTTNTRLGNTSDTAATTNGGNFSIFSLLKRYMLIRLATSTFASSSVTAGNTQIAPAPGAGNSIVVTAMQLARADSAGGQTVVLVPSGSSARKAHYVTAAGSFEDSIYESGQGLVVGDNTALVLFVSGPGNIVYMVKYHVINLATQLPV